MTEFTLECGQCGDQVPESKARIEGQVGVHGRARVAYCPRCQA